MNRWKIVFLLLTGFWLHETLVHVWLGFEGLLPLTSRLSFGITITPEMNTVFIFINMAVTLIFAYFGLMHNWRTRRTSVEQHA